jgi:C1A family cysteine protease
MSTIVRAKSVARLGWVPDLPDHRDHLYAVTAPMSGAPLPPRVDLRPQCPPVYDQLNLGSCTANAIAGAIEFDQQCQRLAAPVVPSRLFIYYNERALEHTVSIDSGASLRDGIKTVAAQGVCPEATWPYVDDGTTFERRPPQSCYQDATRHRVSSYARLPRSLQQIRACLAEGRPFVFGFSVYESMMSNAVAADGQVPMPGSQEQLLGGHAVMAAGYDDAHHVLIVRNSWGASWGLGGYCLMPYAYLLDPNLSDDFWTIRSVQ